MKNNKLKNVYSKFELVKLNKDLVIVTDLNVVRGGSAGNNKGCGATINYKCSASLA